MTTFWILLFDQAVDEEAVVGILAALRNSIVQPTGDIDGELISLGPVCPEEPCMVITELQDGSSIALLPSRGLASGSTFFWFACATRALAQEVRSRLVANVPAIGGFRADLFLELGAETTSADGQ